MEKGLFLRLFDLFTATSLPDIPQILPPATFLQFLAILSKTTISL